MSQTLKSKIMKTRLLLFILFAFSFVNAQVTDGLIQYFNFNGSMNSLSGTATFTNAQSISYGADRNSNPFGAYNKVTGDAPFADITGLPVGNSSRSISVWIKPAVVNADNVVFSYGSPTGNMAYGGSFNATNIYQFSYTTSLAYATSVSTSSWKHIVFTFETGGATKIYVNGVLGSSNTNSAWNTATSTIFNLGFLMGGSSPYRGFIDDLRIYNRAITAAEVLELYDGTPSLTQVVREFKFNNSYADETATSSFYDNGFTNFVADRNSNPNSALRMNTRGTKATINNLPNNTAQRSVSIWYKVANAQSDNVLFVYGSASGQQAYGMSFNNTNSWYNFSWLTNTSATNPSNDGQWHHLVTTFDQSKNSKIYIDGVLLSQQTQNGWSTNATATNFDFWLGGLFSENLSPFDGSVDDLKIYNYALSQVEVTNLFNNNSLTSDNFNANNLEVGLYPNPVNDVLNIDTKDEISSVEVFALQGQKVLSSKENKINVSQLPAGIYLVRIEDVNNNIATKKIIKN